MTKILSRNGARPVQGIVAPIIVTRKGRIARLESSLTPHEAQVEDLLFLRKVLRGVNIPFLLVRDGARPRR